LLCKQRCYVGAVARINRGTDAEAEWDLLAAHLEGVCHRLQHPAGKHLGSSRLRAHAGYEGELVAADAGHESAVRSDLEPARHCAQKLVADHVPKDVVGFLEVIEVDRQHNERLAAALGPLERL
jgi:hypothetical protein